MHWQELCNEDEDGARYCVRRAPYDTQTDMTQPYPDPGEEYRPHINTQLYGEADVPPDIRKLPPMNGFVKDYRTALKAARRWDADADPTPANLQRIMNCFPPEALPVLSGLARSFAVSDEWFCSVPSQTFCNRSFFHSGSSHGFVTNSDYVKWLRNEQPTIFEPLGHDWRVYRDADDVASLTRAIHRPLHASKYDENFVTYRGRDMPDDRFTADCRDGKLPRYAFIEPRLLLDHNDMHPASWLNPFVDSSLLAGEILVNHVYDAVRKGKHWERTLLVITFDEHGGCYDHVPPPVGAIPPDASAPSEHEDGFGFDRFGVRVPAIFVSPFVRRGTVVRAPEGCPSSIPIRGAPEGLDGLSLLRTRAGT